MIKYFGDVEGVWSKVWCPLVLCPFLFSSLPLSPSILTCDVVLDQSSTPLLRRRISRKCGEVQLLSPLSPLGEQSACLPACLPACLGAMLRRRERERDRCVSALYTHKENCQVIFLSSFKEFDVLSHPQSQSQLQYKSQLYRFCL